MATTRRHDVKDLALLSSPPSGRDPIRAPCSDDPVLRGAVRELRARGEVVVAELPGDDGGVVSSAPRCLVAADGRWAVASG